MEYCGDNKFRTVSARRAIISKVLVIQWIQLYT